MANLSSVYTIFSAGEAEAGSGGDQPAKQYPARLIRVKLVRERLGSQRFAVVTGARRSYAAPIVSGPAGANYNSIFCDALAV